MFPLTPFSPSLSTVLECGQFYVYSHFLLINPYKRPQKKDMRYMAKVKNVLCKNGIETVSDEQKKSHAVSSFITFIPFLSN